MSKDLEVVANNRSFSKFMQFINDQHGDQKRKYTSNPYYTHLERVSNAVSEYGITTMMAAYAHDVLEDTKLTETELFEFIMDECGINRRSALYILRLVKELTDVYTASIFPSFNRAKRKELEAYRLWSISPIAQTIKYVDIIDNLNEVIPYDENFAKVFINEKKLILSGMNKGNLKSYKEATLITDNGK